MDKEPVVFVTVDRNSRGGRLLEQYSGGTVIVGDEEHLVFECSEFSVEFPFAYLTLTPDSIGLNERDAEHRLMLPTAEVLWALRLSRQKLPPGFKLK